MHEGKLCWNFQKAALEENFAVRKCRRILIETKFIYLFNAVSLTMTISADYSGVFFLSFLFANNFVVIATKTFHRCSLVHSEQIYT